MTLVEAYHWYQSTRKTFQRVQRLARRYWDQLPVDLPVCRDPQFVDLQGITMEEDAKYGADQLEDWGIFLLFACFEREFREHVALQVIQDTDSIKHPVNLKAVNESLRQVEKESLDRVLTSYAVSSINDSNLVLRVQQIREFRNWVAHGRKGSSPCFVEPITAFEVLKELLDVIRIESKRLQVV